MLTLRTDIESSFSGAGTTPQSFADIACAQIVQFLKQMQADVDFSKIDRKVGIAAKGPQGGHQTPFAFDPMRRKAHVPGSEAQH